MQQQMRNGDVANVCRRARHVVNQSGELIHADMCFHAEYHCWPLRVWCIAGSRFFSEFLVELGAWMIVPARRLMPFLAK